MRRSKFLFPASPASAVCALLSVPPITVPLKDCVPVPEPPALPTWCCADPDEPSDESVPCTSEAANVIGAKLMRMRTETTVVPMVRVTRRIRYSERTP